MSQSIHIYLHIHTRIHVQIVKWFEEGSFSPLYNDYVTACRGTTPRDRTAHQHSLLLGSTHSLSPAPCLHSSNDAFNARGQWQGRFNGQTFAHSQIASEKVWEHPRPPLLRLRPLCTFPSRPEGTERMADKIKRNPKQRTSSPTSPPCG